MTDRPTILIAGATGSIGGGAAVAFNGLILSVGVFIEKGPNILASGDEVMFATNVMGPFLFTQLLSKRMEKSNGLVLHVIAPFHKRIDKPDEAMNDEASGRRLWDALELLTGSEPQDD